MLPLRGGVPSPTVERVGSTDGRHLADLLHFTKAIQLVPDPSHGTGHWEYVAPMDKASVACGADGLLIEVHPTPETAQSDGRQSLKLTTFQQLMDELRPIALAVGRRI
ncbi:MAG: hypothetical protein M5R38_14440 [Candidatus Methylomirabilis sp.]|nr:hypothetical protein [Candidatus Methylomirabilis sp.]